jgi:hypothetical protein
MVPSKQPAAAADKVAGVDLIGAAAPVLANRVSASSQASTPAIAQDRRTASTTPVPPVPVSHPVSPAPPQSPAAGQNFEQRPRPSEHAQSATNAQQALTAAPAVPAEALAPQMNFARALAATGRSRTDMEPTALNLIHRGGRVDFDVQHIHPADGAAHPAQLRVTGTTLEFTPEGPCDIGAFAVPLAAVTSMQMDQGMLNISFRSAGQQRHIRLKDATPNIAPPAQAPHLLASVRNVIIAARARRKLN